MIFYSQATAMTGAFWDCKSIRDFGFHKKILNAAKNEVDPKHDVAPS
jgi:hypothetical protein